MTFSSRRDFLRFGAAGAAAGLAVACAAPSPTAAPSAQPTSPPIESVPEATPSVAPVPTPAPRPAIPPDKRTLVVIQLSGGQDGLNALVPYGNGLYYQLRPQIGVPADQVVPLSDTLGLHPNLKPLKALYDQGHLAIIQGVGYPNPNRSHFRSLEIWHTARPDGPAPNHGWLGDFIAQVYRVGDSPFQCVNFGNSVPLALQTNHAPVAALQDTNSFQFLVDRGMPYLKDPLLKTFGQVYGRPARKTPALELVAETWATTRRGVEVLGGAAEGFHPMAQYSNTPFGHTLQQVSQMLAADLGTRVFYVQLAGFDTHANEKPTHATLMTQLADGLAAFQADLEGHGRAEQVLTMGFSEFGRRVKENGSQGTDHGAAGPMFVLGKSVKGGLYGDQPDLANLDEGDLRHTVDFRSVYATVVENWLGAPAQEVLGGSFERLNFLG